MSDFDLLRIVSRLEQSKAKIVMFADGFVDEVWEIVNARANLNDYTVYSQMRQFAERISNSRTGGIGLEIVKKRRAFGGFSANTGYASARLGVDTAVIGVFGKDKPDPVFEEVNDICHLTSLGAPATTHILEFDDGKILMSYMEATHSVCWKQIVDILGMEKINSLLSESDIIGVGYWSLLPAFDEIVSQVCAHLPNDGKKRRFFFDFADFLKRDKTSLIKTLQDLKILNEKFPMTLSVNEHEAAALFSIHNETMDDEQRPLLKKIEYVREQIGLDELVIHTPHYAAAASQSEKAVFTMNQYIKKPLRSVGAGDSFNGGYIAASLAELDISERLFVANTAVSFFLQSAKFPELSDLLGARC